eukprot:1910388-Amphidinium_carterae.1
MLVGPHTTWELLVATKVPTASKRGLAISEGFHAEPDEPPEVILGSTGHTPLKRSPLTPCRPPHHCTYLPLDPIFCTNPKGQ